MRINNFKEIKKFAANAERNQDHVIVKVVKSLCVYNVDLFVGCVHKMQMK